MRFLLSLSAVILMLAGSTARADFKYNVTDLGPFQPLAVNGSGTVLGLIALPSTPVLATYSNGLVDPIPNDHSLFFNGITIANFFNDGTIAFSANVTTNSNNTTQFGAPVIYKNGSYTVVPNVTGLLGIPNSWGLNHVGVAAGNVQGVGNFVYDGNSTTTSTNDRYFAFNDIGQQLGVVRQAPFGLTMVINNNGTISTLLDSRNNPLFVSGPSVINNNEYAIIAGGLGTISGSHFSALPTIGVTSTYVSLADSNLAVGSYTFTGAGNTQHALFFDGTTAVDLNTLIDPTSFWELRSATWVGDTGYIIGQGTHNGVTANFLLTPVPEAVVSGLVLIGVPLLFARRRHPAANMGAQR